MNIGGGWGAFPTGPRADLGSIAPRWLTPLIPLPDPLHRRDEASREISRIDARFPIAAGA